MEILAVIFFGLAILTILSPLSILLWPVFIVLGIVFSILTFILKHTFKLLLKVAFALFFISVILLFVVR